MKRNRRTKESFAYRNTTPRVYICGTAEALRKTGFQHERRCLAKRRHWWEIKTTNKWMPFKRIETVTMLRGVIVSFEQRDNFIDFCDIHSVGMIYSGVYWALRLSLFAQCLPFGPCQTSGSSFRMIALNSSLNINPFVEHNSIERGANSAQRCAIEFRYWIFSVCFDSTNELALMRTH